MTVLGHKPAAAPNRTLPDTAPAAVGLRHSGLDRLRGLAILLMATDHLAYFFGVEELRTTLGRVAMPLFFVLGGHLARRYAWRRYLELAAVGLVVQLLAPWSGAGPLLLSFVAGAVVLVGVRRHPLALALLLGWGLTLGANGYAEVVGVAYDPRCLVGLMALGALLPRELFAPASRLPAWLAPLGRRPLLLYAGHVLALTVLFS